MSKFLNSTNHTIAWFKKAFDSGELVLKPPFQRNPVWTDAQRSFLVDSILNGYPIPEIYLQETIDGKGVQKNIVVDGQQRLRACVEFISGGYRIEFDGAQNWLGLAFDELTEAERIQFYAYTFVVRVLPPMPDEQIRDIFQRLNRNVVALNAQELRQATYWGPFLKTIQEISNWPYWSTAGIFTPLNMRRLMDAEFISEISVAVLHGPQNKKEKLDDYYQMYEVEFEQRDELIETFKTVLEEIEALLPDIKNQRWRKKSDFYSLFLWLAENKKKLPLTEERRVALRTGLIAFAADIDSFVGISSVPSKNNNAKSYADSIRASSDLSNRKRRQECLERQLAALLGAEIPKKVEIKPQLPLIYDSDEVED